jgi:WD40 repeat protein
MVRLWDLSADSRTDRWGGHTASVGALVVAPGGEAIVTAGADGRIFQWRKAVDAGVSWWQSAQRVNGLAYSGNHTWIASSGYPRTGAVWDAGTGRRLAELGVDGASRAVAFSDDSRHILVGEVDGTLRIWEWNGTAAVNPRAIPSKDTEVLGLTTRGNLAYVAHRRQALVVREIDSGREMRRYAVPAAPFSVALSPDARLVATGTWVGAVNVWDTRTGAMVNEFKGQTALINGLDFSPDGTLLASSSRDGSTRLWDMTTGRWLATVASRGSGAEHVRFFPDGRHIAIGYQDGEVEIRDLDYFFRYVAGHADYQLGLFRQAGETFPRAADVLEWSRGVRR